MNRGFGAAREAPLASSVLPGGTGMLSETGCTIEACDCAIARSRLLVDEVRAVDEI